MGAQCARMEMAFCMSSSPECGADHGPSSPIMGVDTVPKVKPTCFWGKDLITEVDITWQKVLGKYVSIFMKF